MFNSINHYNYLLKGTKVVLAEIEIVIYFMRIKIYKRMMPHLLDKIIKGIVTATSKNADVKK
jgi:hypothetical protein